MIEYNLIIPAFIAGLLTFLAPCTLPLVPAYLGLISGVPIQNIKEGDITRGIRWKVFYNGFLFVIGFSVVFVVFWSNIWFFG